MSPSRTSVGPHCRGAAGAAFLILILAACSERAPTRVVEPESLPVTAAVVRDLQQVAATLSARSDLPLSGPTEVQQMKRLSARLPSLDPWVATTPEVQDALRRAMADLRAVGPLEADAAFR